MAVSEMSRRSRSRRAYPLRQPPEKAEPGMAAHSARFGNFRNLPQHTKMALGATSAISGEKDAASHRLPQSARHFPTTERLARRARTQPKRPRTPLARCHFFVCFFRKLTKAPKVQTSALVSTGGGRASPPHTCGNGRERAGDSAPPKPRPGPLPPPPGQEEVRSTDFGTSATHRGAPAKGGGLHRSPFRCSVLVPSFIPSLPACPPFFSLRRPCTHRDKG